MEGKAKKQQKVSNIFNVTVFALHPGKMTAIMVSVLTTLVTNNTNTVNRVKSDMDGICQKKFTQFFNDRIYQSCQSAFVTFASKSCWPLLQSQ